LSPFDPFSDGAFEPENTEWMTLVTVAYRGLNIRSWKKIPAASKLCAAM
jgi:hypothetical protein